MKRKAKRKTILKKEMMPNNPNKSDKQKKLSHQTPKPEQEGLEMMIVDNRIPKLPAPTGEKDTGLLRGSARPSSSAPRLRKGVEVKKCTTMIAAKGTKARTARMRNRTKRSCRA